MIKELMNYFENNSEDKIREDWEKSKDIDIFQPTKECVIECLDRVYMSQRIIDTMLTENPLINSDNNAIQCVDRVIEHLENLYNYIKNNYKES